MNAPMEASAGMKLSSSSSSPETALDQGQQVRGNRPRLTGAEPNAQSHPATPAPGPARAGRRPTIRCVWPTDYRNTCRRPATLGHTCPEHVGQVRCNVGTLDCAWPGCTRRAWDRKGLCSFHWKVAFDLIDR